MSISALKAIQNTDPLKPAAKNKSSRHNSKYRPSNFRLT